MWAKLGLKSLKSKLSVLFGIALLSVLLIFYAMAREHAHALQSRMLSETLIFIHSFIPKLSRGDISSVYGRIEDNAYIIVTKIPDDASIIYTTRINLVHIKIFRNEDVIGFSLKYLDESIIAFRHYYYDASPFGYLYTLLGFVLVIFLVLYIYILRLLSPLSELKSALLNYQDYIHLTPSSEDEIGTLIGAYNEMSTELKTLIKARSLIIKNIAHELKTPLAKIRLELALDERPGIEREFVQGEVVEGMVEREFVQGEVVENSAIKSGIERKLTQDVLVGGEMAQSKLTQDSVENSAPLATRPPLALEVYSPRPHLLSSSQKQRILRYTDGINRAVDTMLAFERVHGRDIALNTTSFEASSLLLEALRDFEVEESDIVISMHSFVITGDFDLLAICLKNLISNALKYAASLPIYIDVNARDRSIVVANTGAPLSHPIEYYLAPFYRDEAVLAKQGYGLGLSIISEILTLHTLRLGYKYTDGKHNFYLNLL